MLCDFIIISKSSKIPLYTQIYSSIRKAVENGSLAKGVKLPSVRQLSCGLSVSKTTVSAAYEQLCVEGYIKNKPQSGYYVEAQFDSAPKHKSSGEAQSTAITPRFEYDFTGKSIDSGIINISEWKKYVKAVLNKNYLLTSYGEPQGEYALRKALQKYALGVRSVNTSTENIVVGAGTQSLLYILCSLLGLNKTAAVSKNSYKQAEVIFKSFGYKIEYFDDGEYGADISSVKKINPDIVLINPNFTNENGLSMPISRRLELIKWAKTANALIIEDDYNGELRYSTHPLPCVQNYSTEDTVYLGSFSKILLPAVRISYMALPDSLIKKYEKIKPLLNQTASKAEQTALAGYLENASFDAHLRKTRRIYLEKSKIILESVYKYFGKNTNVIFNETSLYISVDVKSGLNTDEIEKRLNKSSIGIMPSRESDRRLNLSFSGIPAEKIDSGIKKISELICEYKT